MNPVFLREMREAMRQEAKSDSWNIGYLVCAVVLFGGITTAISMGYYHVTAPVVLFYFLAFVETIFITRGSNAAFSLAMERAQNTFESLFLTPLSPARYLRGQLLYNASMVLRRIAQMLPFFGMVYLLGGFALGQFLMFQVLLVAYSIASNAGLYALADGVVSADWISQQLKRSAGKRRIANMNPSVIFASVVFPFFFSMISTGGPGGFAWQLLSGTVGLQPSNSMNFLRGAAAIHPFFALALWGDIHLFGVPVPIWLYCLIAWALMAQAAFFTFVYQLTMRRFRYNIGLRLGRWVLFAGIQVLIAAVGWEEAYIALGLSVAHMTAYALFRFTIPQRIPVRTEGDAWQWLPRRDLFVNRAGNLFPYFLVTMLPAIVIQYILAAHIPSRGIETAVALVDIEILLCVATILFGGQALQIRSAIGALKKAYDPSTASSAKTGTDEKAKSGKPMNPVLGGLLFLWIIPLPVEAIADSLMNTPLVHYARNVKRIVEPVLYYNPIRFVFELVSNNGYRLFQKTGLLLANHSAVTGSRHDYYIVSLGMATLGTAAALYFSVRWNARYRRAMREWGEQIPDAEV